MNQINKEIIVKAIESSENPLKLNEIGKMLKIKLNTQDYDLLKISVDELVMDNSIKKLSRRRYIKVEKAGNFETKPDKSFRIKGVLRINDEKGSVTDKISGLKYSIKRKNILTALDGDTVEIMPLAGKKGKKVLAEITKVITRAARIITGTIEFDGFFYFLIPDETKYAHDFLIPVKKLNSAKPGDKVSAKFLKWDDPLKSPEAEIIKKLGPAGDTFAEYESVLQEFNLNAGFNKQIIAEAGKITGEISKSEIAVRRDLRKEEIITIDPDDAKDFDDAISLKILENGNYYLGVHIADVSHYVVQHSLTDREALFRGNSTYLVDRVVPMLPETLSNEICSLKPNRNRLTYSVFMEFTPKGLLKNYEIVESVIRSKKRFTYDEVLKIIENKEGEHCELILKLHELAEILKDKRFKSGGVNFETVEIRFKLDENKIPIKAIQKQTTKSTSLVEECMLAANKTVAEHILKLQKKYKLKEKLPFLYRVHDEPNPDKLNSVLEFIMALGHKGDARTGGGKAINKLLAQFENRPEKPIVHQMLVRAMPRAEYQPQNIGHYGLGYSDYAHFTSPIRRYPDLIVHRLLKEYNKSKPEQKRCDELIEYLQASGDNCTFTERNSMEAERSSVKLAQAILANRHIGEEFEGTISGVTSFGIFVILDRIFAEGLIHIRDLYDDYYVFDEKFFRLVGRHNHRIYQFGGKVKAKIIRVSIDRKKIDLKIIESKKDR